MKEKSRMPMTLATTLELKNETFISQSEARRRYGQHLSYDALQRLVRERKVSYFRPGRVLWLKLQDLEKYLAESHHAATETAA
jgi:hypothetical protein